MYFIPAVDTLYGDWNGDCAITNVELADLEDAIEYGPYNPLMDYDCDGDLTAQVEMTAALANFRIQPDCGEEDGGGGGESYEDDVDVEGLAEWIADVLTEEELEEFVAGLTVAAEEFEGTRVGDDMAELLAYLQ